MSREIAETQSVEPASRGQMPLLVIACQFAGANRYAYRPLQTRLAPDIELLAFELPGRGARAAEALLTDIRSSARHLLEPALSAVGSNRYALFGHSMGARIAHLLARMLPARGAQEPAHLVVSGSIAPSLAGTTNRHRLSRDDLITALRVFGGCPEEFLKNRELLDLFLPIIRADIQATETYIAEPSAPLRCPLTVFRGTEDEVTRDQAERWQRETTGTCSVFDMPGRHFFLFDDADRFTSSMRRTLLRTQGV